MVEPGDAKELIEEAIEEAEKVDHAERLIEKRFRNQVSILVGLFAVLLAIIHVAAAGNARESVLKTIEASDTYNYMQAKIIREAILKAAAKQPSLSPDARASMLMDAQKLRNPDKAGHGILQLQPMADRLREEGQQASRKGEWYEFAETAMQVAIVLLSIALVARSWAIVAGAVSLAGAGLLMAVATAGGFLA
jgi:cellobiose-specific phosphotransferase system component IIA